MPSKKHNLPKHIPSQHHASHLAQERKRQLWVLGTGGLLIVSAVIVLLAGLISQWFVPVYLPLQKTVLTVDSRSYNMNYLVQSLRFYSGGQLDYASMLVDAVVKNIGENNLIAEAAAKKGITVADAEVKAKIKEAGYDNNSAIRDIVKSQLLYNKLLTEMFDKTVPTTALQRQALVMLLESETQALAVQMRLNAGEDFSAIVKELSLDSDTITKNGDFGFHPSGGIFDSALYSSGIDAKIFGGKVGEVGYYYDSTKSKQLGYWVVKVTERKTENSVLSAHVYGILLPTEGEAQKAVDRINAGEDFAKLAEELSQDSSSKAKGGDMDWKTLGATSAAFDTYIFNEKTPLNQISQAIKDKNSNTNGAYWLYKINAERNEKISDDDRTTLKQKAYDQWVKDIYTAGESRITLTISDDQKAFAAEQASK